MKLNTKCNSWDKVRKFGTIETLEKHLRMNGKIELKKGQLDGRIRIGDIHHLYDCDYGAVIIQQVNPPYDLYIFDGHHLIKEVL